MSFKENTKKFNRALARNTFYVLRWIIARLPYPLYKVLAHFFMALGFPLLNKKRKIALENLRIAFGNERSSEEIEQIYHKCYNHFARGMIDLIYFIDRPKEINEKVKIVGQENLDNVLKAGKGAILVSAHYGSFILMYLKTVLAGYKTNVIMRRVRDEKWEEYISQFRNERGVGTIYDLPPRQCVQKCIRALRNNEILYILLDQNYGGDGRVFVDFFGEPAATATGPVIFSIRTGSPILPVFMRHEGGDRHQLVIEPPFQLERFDDDQETIVANIAKLTKIIEQHVRERPWEWGGWMHKRWKSRVIEEQRILDFLKEEESQQT
ncbi:MAG TPA: lysophospholipid acyltransferase family protein [Candidatus Omnitrophota bacterium]|nr:lysophospholipid acyltransferase family protein [Candidatus Omnitrophota bacterium]